MRILILLKSFNYPPRNGGDQAVFNAINRLAPFVQFHLIGLDGSDTGKKSVAAFQAAYPQIPSCIYDLNTHDTYQRVADKCQRISNFVNNRNGNKASVDMLHLREYAPRLDYHYGLFKFLNQYILENQIDIVQGEFHFILGFLSGISAPVKKVFVAHELQYVVEHQRLLQREHSVDDVFYYEHLRRQELNAMNACDAIITLSKDDKEKLIRNGIHAPVFASFAQISLKEREIEYPVAIKERVVFIGPESHMPNKQGMQWFLEQVFPKIQQKHPHVKLDIIGRWSESTIHEWKTSYRNVDFLGYVDDLEATIANSILIVPLFQGSGIRMKILEACNAGIPFVATPIGAEGLGFEDEQNCFIKDHPQDFAASVIRLMEDNQLANRYIENSMAHIRKHFSDDSFVESRLTCYNNFFKF